jgi:RND family efflux transporter MFP subunit
MAAKAQLDELRIDRSAEPRGRSPILPLALVLLVLVAAVVVFLWARPSAKAVRTEVVRSSAPAGAEAVLNASGYVTARRKATVSSKVTGKVEQVLVEEGMVIEDGQLLATLDDSMTRKALNLAQAQLVAAESALAETRARLTEAEKNLLRIQDLQSQGFSSDSELDAARAGADALRARLEREDREVEVARRQVELNEQQLADMEIRAPFDGVAVSKDAQPGEMISPVSAGGGFTRTGICTLVDMSSLEIEVDVNESYLHRVRPHQPVEAILDAYPDWKIPAQVIIVVPTADRQKATVRVRIGFEELDPRILPDMGVKVAFLGSETATPASPSLVVPTSAVRQDGDQTVVFVVKDDQVERRAIGIGDREGDRTRVTAGLSDGERVVIEGAEGLVDGDLIREK